MGAKSQAGQFVADAVETVAGAAGGAAKRGFKSTARPEHEQLRAAFRLRGDSGVMSRIGAMGKWGASNLKSSFGEGATWGTVAKGMGGHMLRGGVVGGLAGGTIEAAQGGSFWTGAKEGAWNGAIGWGAWRAAGRMTGATTRNPLGAFGKGGVANSAGTMWRATSGNAEVSKQATALLNQAQRNGVTRAYMNRK